MKMCQRLSLYILTEFGQKERGKNMSKKFRRFLSVLLAAAMMLSHAQISFAADSKQAGAPATESKPQSGRELEMEPLDPSTLHVQKLGRITEPQDLEEQKLDHRFDPNDVLRVAIQMEAPSVMDAGYSLNNWSKNTAAQNYEASLIRQQKSVTAQIEKAIGGTLKVKWNLAMLTNVISADVRYADIVKILSVPGVKSVNILPRYEAPTPVDPNTANTSENMVGASAAWLAGYTGAGSRVAIIDTGVDIEHKSFNAAAFQAAIDEENEKRALEGMDPVDLMTASEIPSGLTGRGIYKNAKIPYAYNYVDENTTSLGHENDNASNHGSHVAGIAAANRYVMENGKTVDAVEAVGAIGMAPDAQILLMKVFSSNGASPDDYMAALQDAVKMEADAANLSLGSNAPGWSFDDYFQDVWNNIAQQTGMKIVVAISAGNTYSMTNLMYLGDFTSHSDPFITEISRHTGGSPGSYVNSLGVASADNTNVTGKPLVFNGEVKAPYLENLTYTSNNQELPGTNAPISTIAGTRDFVYIDGVGLPEEYAAVDAAVSLEGKVVIVNRGGINFSAKDNNLVDYKPAALIVANNAPGNAGMSPQGFTGTFPAVMIQWSEAKLLQASGTAVQAGDVSYFTGQVEIPAETVGREETAMSSFSSWGVPGSMLMKPDITAPGGDIYSVYGKSALANDHATDHETYGLMSGTSMAAPHVAGLAAVAAQFVRDSKLEELNPELSGKYSTRAIVQSLLMSTATPMKDVNGRYLSLLQTGAGLADVGKAVGAKSVVMIEGNASKSLLTTLTGAAADGKVKAELGDDLFREKDGEYYFSVRVYNTSDTDLTFDTKAELFTQDNYKYKGDRFLAEYTAALASQNQFIWEPLEITIDHDVNKDGVTNALDAQAILDYMTGNTEKYTNGLDTAAGEMDGVAGLSSYDAYLLLQALKADSQYADGVVPAHGSRELIVVLQLTDAQMEALDAAYPVGAYVEGFVYLSCATVNTEGVSYEHEHSIPVLGYYGSWTDASMYDGWSVTGDYYGTATEPYSDQLPTNYMSVKYSGIDSYFVGNPYYIEDQFPAERLAINSHDQINSIVYTLLRAAGTVGFAISKTNGIGGSVTDIIGSSLIGYEVDGVHPELSSAGLSVENKGAKTYYVNKSAGEYGLEEGDTFRIGVYAVPEYYGILASMILNEPATDAESGLLNSQLFPLFVQYGFMGDGAMMGFDLKVDDTAPEFTAAPVLEGNTISFAASDNQNLAYVAVMSLDGETVYAEDVPAGPTAELSFNIAEAIANANGYVAVFAADYAGNEAAAAVKVNDNAGTEETLYVLTDTITFGNEYLIVNKQTPGQAYSVYYTVRTEMNDVKADEVTILAGKDMTDNKPYIEASDVMETAVWKAKNENALQNGTISFYNGDYNYLTRTNNSPVPYLAVIRNSNNRFWTWDSEAHTLSIRYNDEAQTKYYLRYSGGNFSINKAVNSVYLFEKVTISNDTIDPYAVTGVEIIPDSLDLYKGATASLATKVSPLTASDRSVTWSSADETIATVDAGGTVTAVSQGTTTVRATSNADPAIYADCTVKVTEVDKTLNAAVYDEKGQVFFSSFNPKTLPTWTKLSDAASDDIHSAFMGNASTLYASNFDNDTSYMYTVDRTAYALSRVGEIYVPACDMAAADSGYFVYGYGPYLIYGNISPQSYQGAMYSGLPYGVLDHEEYSGGASVAGVAAAAIGARNGTYYYLDTNGTIWKVELDFYNDFAAPTKVLDTGISTTFYYQNLYYDGTYLYWSHTDSSEKVAELIIINPTTKAVYQTGKTFGDDIWPAVGLYVDGAVAPAATDDIETPAETKQVLPITRDQIMKADIVARMDAEWAAVKQSAKFAPATEAPVDVTEAPADVTEVPEPAKEVTEAPADVTDVPEPAEEVTEAPADVTEATEPAEEVTEAPELVEEVTGTPAEPTGEVTEAAEPAETEAPAEEASEEEVPAEEEPELAELPSELNGGANSVGFTFDAQKRNETVHVQKVVADEPSVGDDKKTVTVTLKEDAAVTNGFVVITYDPAYLTYVSAESELPYHSVRMDKEDGILFAYASEDKLAAGTELLTLVFETNCTETDGRNLTVLTKERNTDLALTETETVNVPAAPHDWININYEWLQKNEVWYCKATAVCKNNENHKLEVEVQAEVTDSSAADCLNDGYIVYTAVFYDYEGILEAQEKRETIPALGHDYSGEPASWNWTGSDDTGYTAASAVFVCTRDEDHETKTVEATVTSEAVDGVMVYTATVTGPDGKTYTDVKRVVIKYKLTVLDYTDGADSEWQPVSGSAVVKIDGEAFNADTGYVGTVSVTVEHSAVCAVGILKTDGTIERLMSSSTESGIYELNVDADMTLVIVLKGDVKMDGAISGKDSTLLKQHIVGSANPALNDLQLFAAETVDYSGISAKDATKIAQVVVGNGAFEW